VKAKSRCWLLVVCHKQVARELGISGGTVKGHMHSIFQKLGTKGRYSLINLAGLTTIRREIADAS
jgi:DNA-binding NarL/FixJ family response regulator